MTRPCKQCGQPVYIHVPFGRPECSDCAGLNHQEDDDG